MRDYREIEVERGAVHVVAPRVGQLRLTEAELDLSGGVGAFLAGHVERGLADPRARAAAFTDGPAGRAGAACAAVLASGSCFVAGTAQLARLLHEASASDERVADGTLAVLRCRSGGSVFAAILKLDPSDAYRTVEEVDGDGRRRIRLALAAHILPGVRERLQKAAFVRTVGGPAYDLLVVDRQRSGDTVSAYFLHDFLGAEPALDDVARTRALYRALTAVRNEVAPALAPPARARLERYLDGAVVGDRVNVDELVAGLPVGDAHRRRFADRIVEALPDREFALDAVTARSFVAQRRFTGDNRLRLTVPAEFHDDMVRAEHGDDGMWRVTIHTREWKES
jgi:hypothetical protein